jgi:hypothetical protein
VQQALRDADHEVLNKFALNRERLALLGVLRKERA